MELACQINVARTPFWSCSVKEAMVAVFCLHCQLCGILHNVQVPHIVYKWIAAYMLHGICIADNAHTVYNVPFLFV